MRNPQAYGPTTGGKLQGVPAATRCTLQIPSPIEEKVTRSAG